MKPETFTKWSLLFVCAVVASFMGSIVFSQSIEVEEYSHTTSNHFASIFVYNEVGSATVSPDYETKEGTVVVDYTTYGNSGCGQPSPTNTHPSSFNEPSFKDCPDYVYVETPEGILAVPNEFYMDEENTVEIKLYRYVGS